MGDALDLWFAQEVLVHEEALVRYLRYAWPNRDEVDDLRQEIYVRVYEAAARSRPSSPKSFLFTAARNLIVDRVRRGRVVSIEAIGGLGDLDALNVFVDEPSVESRASVRQELKRVAGALDRLPPRCREMLWLRRVEDLPQKEVARRLGVSEGAVEKGLARGVQLLAAALFGGSDEKDSDEGSTEGKGARATSNEAGHGKRQGD